MGKRASAFEQLEMIIRIIGQHGAVGAEERVGQAPRNQAADNEERQCPADPSTRPRSDDESLAIPRVYPLT